MSKSTKVTLTNIHVYKIVLRYINYDPIHPENLLNKIIEFLVFLANSFWQQSSTHSIPERWLDTATWDDNLGIIGQLLRSVYKNLQSRNQIPLTKAKK